MQTAWLMGSSSQFNPVYAALVKPYIQRHKDTPIHLQQARLIKQNTNYTEKDIQYNLTPNLPCHTHLLSPSAVIPACAKPISAPNLLTLK